VTLYSAVQIALRNVIGTTGIEDVLGQKADLGKNLKELVDPVAKQFGYELDAVQVRDLMIVGDLKRVFTQVMSAKQEALACLEKARGEAAAIRVMGNAARVYENSPVLLQLQFLKTLEGAGYNNQLIMGPLDPLTSFLRK
jgi:regulator of protease activity HflC (stomatin/prohibitin superfamily)